MGEAASEAAAVETAGVLKQLQYPNRPFSVKLGRFGGQLQFEAVQPAAV